MLIPTKFAIGLLAYVRQAALSLDRIACCDIELMREFYRKNMIPTPSSVLNRLEELTVESDSIKKKSKKIFHFLSRATIDIDEAKIKKIENALYEFRDIFDDQIICVETERVKVRLHLSEAEESVRESLGEKRALIANNINHLNATEGIELNEFREIAGADWLSL